MKIEFDFNIPSKKNSYRIHFNQAFYRQIHGIVNQFRKYGKAVFWIAPDKKIIEAENKIALVMKQIPYNQRALVAISNIKLTINVQVKNKLKDIDNLLGVIFDGMEKGLGDGFNDRQIREVHLKVDNSKKINHCEIHIEIISKC